MDIKKAYEIPVLEKLTRTMKNNKTGEGTIMIKDEYSASISIAFETAVMVNIDYEIVDDNRRILRSENQKVQVEIDSEEGNVKIIDELVPVDYLSEGGPAYRIGVVFAEPLKKKSIIINYTPLNEEL